MSNVHDRAGQAAADLIALQEILRSDRISDALRAQLEALKADVDKRLDDAAEEWLAARTTTSVASA